MTEQGAIERLRQVFDYPIPQDTKRYEALKMAIESLEKQIVKPPKFETVKGGFVQKRCVVCGNKILPFYASYCTSCGQRLE